MLERWIELAREGDDEAFARLALRYRPMARAIANRYFAPGRDEDDFLQDCRVGLWNAVHGFTEDAGTFDAFAYLCMLRQAVTGLKAALRGKHAPLNDALSFEFASDPDEPEMAIGRSLVSPDPSAQEQLEMRDRVERLLVGIAVELSALERAAVVTVCLGDGAYRDVDVETKSVDNALQRARRKLRPLACP